MTTTALNTKNTFNTNGVTVDFPFTFAVAETESVYALTEVDGVETPYENFSVTLATSAEGGNFHTNDVLDGVVLVVYRSTVKDQEAKFTNGGKFPAQTVEESLDKLTRQNQEQQEVLDRCLQTPMSDDKPYMVLTETEMEGYEGAARNTEEFAWSNEDKYQPWDGGDEKYTATGIANKVEADAAEQRGQFEATVAAQFMYALQGNISDYAGQELTADQKLWSFAYPDGSDDHYGTVQSQDFPVTIPSNPRADPMWGVVSGISKETADKRGTVEFASIEDMIAYRIDGVVDGSYVIGQKCSAGGTKWEVVSIPVSSIADFKHLTTISANDYDSANDAIGNNRVSVQAGDYSEQIAVTSGLNLSGEGRLSTLFTVTDEDGIVTTDDTLRNIVVSDMTIQSSDAGTGTGVNFSNAALVNSKIGNLTVNDFEIGYQSSTSDFSNTFENFRANTCGTSFVFSSGGQHIQNTYNTLYSSQPTLIGMTIDGAVGAVFSSYNSGSAGAPHLRVGLNSTGIIFNAPNFEQDTGSLGASESAVIVGSGSEVTFNSPTFASPSAVSGGYLMRVVDSAVVTINHPNIKAEGAGIDNHLSVEGTAIVYLNDPKGVFTKITVAATAQLIRVYDKLSTSADYATVMDLSDTQLISTDLRALHVKADINTRIGGGALPSEYLKYRIMFDSYSGGSVRARFIDTTTGEYATAAANVPCFVEIWYTELPV